MMIKPFTITHQAAELAFDGHTLTADSSVVRRTWQVTSKGLLTTSLRRAGSDREWVEADAGPDEHTADWLLRGVTDTSDAGLHAVDAKVVEGDARAADHVSARLTFRYPDPGFDVTWEARVWPNAPGIWTRLSLAPVTPFDPDRDSDRLTSYLGWSYGERIGVDASRLHAHACGLYSDTQHRNYDHLPLLRSEPVRRPAGREIVTVDWANLLTLDDGSEALTVVKESPKCVNTPHVDTGEFVLKAQGLYVTGLGISPCHYGSSHYWAFAEGLTCWATWTILHEADEFHRQLAVKRFDRARYPFVCERDGWVMANTWGSGGAWRGAPAATGKDRLLREVASCGDLGIDLLQIDDGWSYAPGAPASERGAHGWKPHPERLPGGWGPICDAAAAAGIDLGLWFPYFVVARNQPEAILDNVRAAKLRRLKLDFIGLGKVDDIDTFRHMISDLVERLGPSVGINWDITEGIPRVGYFFAREWGNLFLANRENGPGPMRQGSHVQYTPRLALREAWHLAHVLNLNQIQITIQDKDATPRDYSNAWRYSHAYAVAIALFGIPLFFQETQNLTPESRAEIKPLLAAYRRHREAMWNGYVFPIGACPDDHGWTGFQSIDGDALAGDKPQSGYLLVFREIDAPETCARIALHGMLNATLSCEDVLTGETWELALDETGHGEFAIPEPGDFRWLRYRKPVGDYSAARDPANNKRT